MASPKSIFYTYAYLRKSDRTPYYIGKGQKDRAFRDHGKIPVPEDRNRIIFLKENITEKEAFKHEIYMIAVFGRKDLGTGILLNMTNGGEGFSGCSEEERERRRETGKLIYEKGVGVFARSKEKHIEDSRKAGNKNKENKTGVCGQSLEKRRETGKKSIKALNSQKWQCTETGYTSNSGGLTCYQKARGIDISNRIKVDGPRSWEITFECGKVVVTFKTLKAWSDENGYNYDCLHSVRKGKCSNYQGIIKVAQF
jgi:hypothetical protein